MAITCATGSILTARAVSSSVSYVQLYSNSWSGNIGGAGLNLECQWGISVVTENQDTDGGSSSSESGNWSQTVSCTADTTYKYRARVYATSYINGTTKSKKSGAVLATASAPSVTAGPTATTVSIQGLYYPNVNASTCSAQLQYKKSSESTWTNAGTAGTDGGYVQRTVSASLTGLTPSTQYQIRNVLTRNTSVDADNEVISSIGTFTTIADDPTITTGAATSVGITGATLNATVDIGGEASVNVKWYWDDATPPETAGALVSYSGNPVSESDTYSYSLSGLTASTTYYARARVYWNSDTEYDEGAIVTFSTTADPGAEASDEDHMQTQYVDGIYGTAQTVTFTLRSPSGTSSNEYYTGTAPDNSTDAEVWLDGTSDGALDNAISRVAGSVVGNMLYSTEVSAAQMSADVVDIVIHDATASEAFRDHHIQIRTKQLLSQVVVDASNRTDTTAVTYTGVGTGHGLSCVGGATGKDIDGYLSGPAGVLYWADDATGDSSTQVTLSTGTSAYDYIAQNDAYNGHILVVLDGTGAGQARSIKDYTSAGVVTLSSAMNPAPSGTIEVAIIPAPTGLDTSPGAELSALPTYASSYGAMLQFLFQRFAYKRYQDSDQQILYKADSATAIATGTFEDNTTDQTLGKLA